MSISNYDYANVIYQIHKLLITIKHGKKFGYVQIPDKLLEVQNSYYNCTSEYIYIEATINPETNQERIICLWTPFGKIDLIRGGYGDDILEVSALFLEQFDGKLKDVTNSIQVCPIYHQEEDWCSSFNYGVNHFLDLKYDHPTKIYLIEQFKTIQLCHDIEHREPYVVYRTVTRSKHSYDESKESFKLLFEYFDKLQ